MSLTPDQWRELDEAERTYAEAMAAFDDRVPGSWRPLEATALMLNILVKRHLRTLIDAARPKCQRCSGYGNLRSRTLVKCPDCNGRGWAA